MLGTASRTPGTPAATSTGRDPDVATLRAHLVRAAAARKAQLSSLRPAGNGDVVAKEHQASVRRILDAIHFALDRMDAGTYGDCICCGALMPRARLVDRPWVARCERCSSRSL